MSGWLRKAAFLLGALLLLSGTYVVYAWSAMPVEDDPLVRMPGTQPGEASLEDPHRCLNCHAGYDEDVEPGFNWQGSMMSQSARDFLFFAAMTTAAQDSIWATGRPNATDICLRCHFPKGWLEGRSDPTNASIMAGADFDGVQCDLCHSMVDPHFETTYAGTREGNDWLGYWDETNYSGTPSQDAADATYAEDALVAASVTLFDGDPFYAGNEPFSPIYTEAAGGQYLISPSGAKRASFADADARHQMYYSRFHRSRYFCATCHDVSNPVLVNLDYDGTTPGDGTTVLPSESQPAYAYFHAERTFSEFMLSAYAQEGGAPGDRAICAWQLPHLPPRRQHRDLPGLPHTRRSRLCRQPQFLRRCRLPSLRSWRSWQQYRTPRQRPANPRPHRRQHVGALGAGQRCHQF